MAGLSQDPKVKEDEEKAEAKVAGFVAKTGAGRIFSKETSEQFQNRFGSTILKSTKMVPKLSSKALGSLSSGAGQAVSDRHMNLSPWQRIGRVALAVGITVGVGLIVAGFCAGTAGGGCGPAMLIAWNMVGNYISRKVAGQTKLGEKIGLGKGF